MHIHVAAVNAVANRLPQSQFVRLQRFRYTEFHVQKTVIDALYAEPNRPAAVLCTHGGIAGHGTALSFSLRGCSFFCVCLGTHVYLPGAALFWFSAGASSSSSVNCKSCRRA